MRLFRFVSCLCVLGLLFSGCQSTQPFPESTTLPTVIPTAPKATAGTLPAATLPEGELTLQPGGSLRIGYTGIRCSAQYITDPSQLPDYEAFRKYDAAFFASSALLLITDTVGSGSTQISIDSVIIDGTTAAVTLRRTLPGDVGTADMATWLLWAEVPAVLALNWKVANPAYENTNNAQTH